MLSASLHACFPPPLADCGYLTDALTEVAIDDDIPCDFTPVLNEDFVPCATFETLAYSQDFNVSDGGYTTTYVSSSPSFTPRTWFVGRTGG